MENATFLILLLVSLGPMILLQWVIGGDLLLSRWRVLLVGTLLAAAYLLLLSNMAIRLGIWAINPAASLNWQVPILDLPFEEFFLDVLLAILSVQSLILMMALPFVLRRLRWFARTIGKIARHGLKSLDEE